MGGPAGIEHARQLLVEGRDAEVFIQALMNHLGIQDVQVQDYRGVNDLPVFLKALRQAPHFKEKVTRLGVIRDAETDARAALQSVSHALQAARLPVPAKHSHFVGSHPEVGYFILPDGISPGMLESLRMASVEADPVIPCVEAYFLCLQGQGLRPPIHPEKARAHAFLASRDAPDLMVGEAAWKGYWSFDHGSMSGLRSFLSSIGSG